MALSVLCFSPRPFFDLCDGVFLNYGWSVPLLQASGTLAGDRRGDVYVGVDVFGRDCYGGGGYNTNKVHVHINVHVYVYTCGCVYVFME